MSEQQEKELDITYKIPVERFRYLDELQEENKNLKKKMRKKRTFTVIFCVLFLVMGLLIATFFPLPLSKDSQTAVQSVQLKTSTSKIQSVLNIMENSWYFKDEIEDLSTRLTDQALTGITTNEEDIHTEYMSEEEITSFTQTINRNFVGIGVQFTSSATGVRTITNVFKGSPAEEAGVQAGDILYSVDGESVEGMSVEEIKEKVQGEEGTVVTIEFLRNTEIISLDITRGQVSHTVDYAMDGEIGTLTIQQFGESTAQELEDALTTFQENGVTKLILDLRDDGGGYLDALQDVCGLFLEKDTVFITREYSDGTVVQSKTTGGTVSGFSPIVILINENTASAAEAFTLALSEQREDVTVVGDTSYGKGTVQVTQYFKDGSAIKYTDSIWKSPNGVWINDTGITPDEEVKLDPVLYSTYEEMAEGEQCELDTVSDYVSEAQLCLNFLGYTVERTDGYFDSSTLEALQAYETDRGIEQSDCLDEMVYTSLITDTIYAYSSDEAKDTQMIRAKEILNESTSSLSYEESEAEEKSENDYTALMYQDTKEYGEI